MENITKNMVDEIIYGIDTHNNLTKEQKEKKNNIKKLYTQGFISKQQSQNMIIEALFGKSAEKIINCIEKGKH